MSTAQDRMREAFDALTLPPDVKAATLEAVEQARAAERTAATASADDSADHARHADRAEQMQRTALAANPRVSAPENAGDHRASASRNAAKRPRRRWAAPIAAAACLVAAAIGFGGYTAYATETAVVGIEINPSIELGINRFDTVVAARALNNDGEALLAEVSIVGDPYAEAIEEIAESSTFAALGEADAVIDVSVVCDDDNQARALMQTSDDAIAACNAAGSCHRATSEDHEAAASAGMGVGRYAAAEELMALDPSVTLEDCKRMSMREIVDAILAIDPDNAFALERCGGHHGQNAAGTSGGQDAGNGSGNGQGSGNARGSDASAGAAATGNDGGSGSGRGHGQNQGQGQGEGRHHGWE